MAKRALQRQLQDAILQVRYFAKCTNGLRNTGSAHRGHRCLVLAHASPSRVRTAGTVSV